MSHPIGFVPLSKFYLGLSPVLPGLVLGLAAVAQGWLVMAETDCYGIEQRWIFSIVQSLEALQPVRSRRYPKYIDLLKSFPVSLQPIADKLGLAKSRMILVR